MQLECCYPPPPYSYMKMPNLKSITFHINCHKNIPILYILLKIKNCQSYTIYGLQADIAFLNSSQSDHSFNHSLKV